MSGLETYVPTACSLEVGGKTLSFGPMRVRQIPGFVAALAPALHLITAGQLLAAVSAHGDALIRASAIASGEPEDWIGELMPDDFVRLVTEVIEVNASFFVARVMPAMTRAEGLMTRLTAHAMTGATPLPS